MPRKKPASKTTHAKPVPAAPDALLGAISGNTPPGGLAVGPLDPVTGEQRPGNTSPPVAVNPSPAQTQEAADNAPLVHSNDPVTGLPLPGKPEVSPQAEKQQRAADGEMTDAAPTMEDLTDHTHLATGTQPIAGDQLVKLLDATPGGVTDPTVVDGSQLLTDTQLLDTVGHPTQEDNVPGHTEKEAVEKGTHGKAHSVSEAERLAEHERVTWTEREHPEVDPNADPRMVAPDTTSKTGSYIDMINGMAVSDDTFVDARNRQARQHADEKTQQSAIKAATGKTLDGEVLTKSDAPGTYSFESRIKILDAYQFTGQAATAPDWVDKNMVGYADYDAVRGIEAGPCLRVPTGHMDDMTLCRIGDFIVRQEVDMGPGYEPDVKIEVWDQMQFLKMFVPTKVAAAQAKHDAQQATRK